MGYWRMRFICAIWCCLICYFGASLLSSLSKRQKTHSSYNGYSSSLPCRRFLCFPNNTTFNTTHIHSHTFSVNHCEPAPHGYSNEHGGYSNDANNILPYSSAAFPSSSECFADSLDSLLVHHHHHPSSASDCPVDPVAASAAYNESAAARICNVIYDDDRDRMVYVSWIPKKARAYNATDKRKMELDLKRKLREEMPVFGLTKVLLFPPKGVHCKLIFDS